MSMDLPRIISVDDHVVEPSHIWTEFLPISEKARAPRVIRRRGRLPELKHAQRNGRGTSPILEEDEAAPWVDFWQFEDAYLYFPYFGINASAASAEDLESADGHRASSYEDIRPGCYEPGARLGDMEINHTDASLCFPTFMRFCGQTLLERKDKEFAHKCVQAYNDWMIEDWCGGDARGHLIPLTLVPLWDAQLAADEVMRCAAMGAHAIAFSENPAALGLPSIHTSFWDSLWAACEEADTVVNMHIGSSSQAPTTGPDAPPAVTNVLLFSGAMHAVIDWLTSGTMERFSKLRIVLSEGQVGWMPFVLERLDAGWTSTWEQHRWARATTEPLSHKPSAYVPGRIFSCIYDDVFGLRNRDEAGGIGQIMFETDFPHGDSTWPNSMKVAADLVTAAGLTADETYKFIRGNAISCYRLDRFGVET